eukprot:1377471-Rhodomonas_salina.3
MQKVQRVADIHVVAVQKPGQTVPGETVERRQQVCQEDGAVHHISIPRSGNPVLQRPSKSAIAMVLVVPQARPQP